MLTPKNMLMIVAVVIELAKCNYLREQLILMLFDLEEERELSYSKILAGKYWRR